MKDKLEKIAELFKVAGYGTVVGDCSVFVHTDAFPPSTIGANDMATRDFNGVAIQYYANDGKAEHQIAFFAKAIEKTIAEKEVTSMKDIIDRIHKWNKDRHISEFSQRQNIVANLLEELTEFHRARCTDAKIDALCDICVFAWGVAPCNEDYENLDDVATSNYRDLPCFVGEFDRTDDSKWLVLIIKTAIQEVYMMNYDFKIAMDETLKEIESRTGSYSTEKGKFVKDEGAYSRREAMQKVGNFKAFQEMSDAWYFDGRKIVKWYKANYSLADKGGRDAN